MKVPTHDDREAVNRGDCDVPRIYPVLRAAVAVLNEMATFADAGVTDAGR